jgi:hypothetical protein
MTDQQNIPQPSWYRKHLVANVLNGKIPVLLWFALPVVAALLEYSRGSSSINNFKIFRGVFLHTLAKTNLYDLYPNEYFDSNHYGPLFSVVIAPFTLLPLPVGLVLWNTLNAWVLYKGIRMLPLVPWKQYLVLLVGCIELMTAAHQTQFNASVAGLIVLSYALVRKEKDGWATLFIAIGFFVKIYGLAGLAFFCFSRHKLRFTVSFAGWCTVLFVLPMLFSSPAFIVQSYADWYHSLVHKNDLNTFNDPYNFQNISVMGMIQRIGNYPQLKSLYVMAPALALYALPFLRFRQYASIRFQLNILASSLLFIVLYSSGSESPTFIIAVTGVAIWFFAKESHSRLDLLLLWLVIIFTSLVVTDLFPRTFRREVVIRYALKALPCLLVWIRIQGELLFATYVPARQKQPAAALQ